MLMVFTNRLQNLISDCLSRYQCAMPAPLVLHGSSGIPDDMLREAIANGICKINLATETKNTFMIALKERLKFN